jgi:hypothetical protein
MTSARIALPTLLLAVLAGATRPPEAGASPWGLAPHEWFASLDGSTFTTSSFHLADGSRAGTGLLIQQRALRLYSEVGWKKNLSVAFGLPALSVTRRDTQVQGTATGFQDVLLGLRYNLLDRASAVAFEVDWNAPAGYNRNLDTLGIHLGDGLQELSAALELGTAVAGRGFVQGSLGYSYRFLGIGKREKGPVVPGDAHTAKHTWSDRLIASGDLAVWVRPSVLLGGRYRGVVTLSNGVLASKTDAHVAGGVLLYRVDDRLDVLAGAWSTISGKETPHVNEFYVGVAFHHTKLNHLQGFLGGPQAS